MADADCEVCRLSGYRSCDECGSVVFGTERQRGDGSELCGYCLEDAGVVQPPPAWAEALTPKQRNAFGIPL